MTISRGRLLTLGICAWAFVGCAYGWQHVEREQFVQAPRSFERALVTRNATSATMLYDVTFTADSITGERRLADTALVGLHRDSLMAVEVWALNRPRTFLSLQAAALGIVALGFLLIYGPCAGC